MSDANILWVDFETTGLMHERHTEPLEVAAIVTDAWANELATFEPRVMKPSSGAVAHMSQYVLEMHTHNGLLGSALASGRPKLVVDQEFSRFTAEWFREGGATVAGNSVGGLDRPIIKKFFPRTDRLCSYRVLDVSSIEQMVTRERPALHLSAPPKDSDHTALKDIKASIAQYAHYVEELFQRGPTS